MPSCVVKICKNNSVDVRKDTGVTFHKFPKDFNRKNKWIKVIRECRNQEAWLPSKFSVVCSVHFEDADVYSTEGGNRRIAKNAVPKLKLFDKMSKKENDEHNSSNKNVSISAQTNYLGFGEDESDSELIIGDRKESTDDRIENVIIKVEPSEVGEKTNIKKQTSVQIQNVIVKVEPKEMTKASSSIKISSDPLAPQQYSEDDLDLQYDSTHYKGVIKRKNDQLKICRKKIKTLYQKVKRYQKRNLKLKNILKEIRYKKLIDKNIFKQLTADLLNKDD